MCSSGGEKKAVLVLSENAFSKISQQEKLSISQKNQSGDNEKNWSNKGGYVETVSRGLEEPRQRGRGNKNIGGTTDGINEEKKGRDNWGRGGILCRGEKRWPIVTTGWVWRGI